MITIRIEDGDGNGVRDGEYGKGVGIWDGDNRVVWVLKILHWKWGIWDRDWRWRFEIVD